MCLCRTNFITNYENCILFQKAKVSLLRKQAGSAHGVQVGKIIKAKNRLEKAGIFPDKKSRRVNLEYDSDNVVSSRLKAPLSVKDRLGKLPLSHAPSSSQNDNETREALLKDSKKKIMANAKFEKETSSSEDEGLLEGIRVKSLEEIRQEKMTNATEVAQIGKIESVTGVLILCALFNCCTIIILSYVQVADFVN